MERTIPGENGENGEEVIGWRSLRSLVLIRGITFSIYNVKQSYQREFWVGQEQKDREQRKQYQGSVQLSSVQFSHSVVSDSLAPHESQHTRPPCPSPTPGVHPDSRPSTQWCHPAISSLSSPSPPVPNPSQHQSLRVFSNESALRMRWPKYWSFSFSIIPSKEIPGLISFRMDWLDLLAVQGTVKSLLQHHSSKASILWRSAFFTVHLSHPYMTTGKVSTF